MTAFLKGLRHAAMGVIGCLYLPLSVIVVGWSYRMAHRSALKAWWKMRPDIESQTPSFLAMEARVPNWILPHDFRKHAVQQWQESPWRLFAWLALASRSLWSNLALGLKAMANTFVMTLVPSLLMLFSWHAGWDNSFNKGYEQAIVGPATGVLGIMLFIAVMFYLPMAQARLAISGRGRSFYHFKRIRTVIRRQCFPCLLLALGYALLSLPIMVMGAFLGVGQGETNLSKPNPLAELSPNEALAFLERYFFFCCLYVFPAYLLLRCWGARIYARGLVKCVRTGRLAINDLTEAEQDAFKGMRLAEDPSRPVRRVLWLGGQGARIAAGVLAVVLWFSVSAQTYVTQFFAYQPVLRWINQPLIQLPWYRQIPPALKKAVQEHPADALASHR